MRAHILPVLATMTLGFALRPASVAQQNVPGGSYQQTCHDIRSDGYTLSARCQRVDGGWNNTSLNYTGCRGEIINDDGNLRCGGDGGYAPGYGGWQGGLPAGSYQQTCRDIRSSDSTLYARCRRVDGGWNNTSLNYRGCRGEIINDDGNLRCPEGGYGAPGAGYGRWEGGLPPGDYKRTCRNMRMDGNRLSANCQRMDGSWNNTSLKNVDRCQSPIYNQNGNLRCQR